MKNYIAISCVLAATACGGYSDDGSDDSELGELGQDEQAFQASLSTNFQFGTQTGTTHQRCNRTSSGQVCSVITTKNPVICTDVNSNLPNFEATKINANIVALDTALNTWTFTGGGQDPITGLCNVGFNVYIKAGAVGSSGTASNDIKDYANANIQTGLSLTEGPGVVGQYVTTPGCTITLDLVDLKAKSQGGIDPFYSRLLKHATLHSLLACMGLGGRTITPLGSNQSPTRNGVTTSNDVLTLTNGEVCEMNSFSTTLFPGEFRNNLIAPLCPE